MIRSFRAALVLSIPLWCSPLSAQGGEPTTEPVTFWRIELAQVERRLHALQEAVLRDPEMARLDSLLGAELAAAMARHDPQLQAAMREVEPLTRRLAEAEAEGDAVATRMVSAALDGLEERFARARLAALEEPGLADRVEVFNEALRLRMIEKSPDAAQLFARLERLNASLSHASATP